MNRKYIKFVVLGLFLIIIIATCFIYFRPIKILDKIAPDVKVNVKLKRRLKGCQVISTVKSKDLKKLLEKDGYVNENDTLVKSFKTNKSCNFLYKNYKNNKVTFKLNGKASVDAEYNQDYEDAGYKVSNKTLKVQKIQDVDVSKTGMQSVVYKLNSPIFNKFLIRKVTVKDTVKPEITLKGNPNMVLYLGNKYDEPGFSANDNHDGDLTNKVAVSGTVDSAKEGNYVINYKVSDASGNECLVERKITVKKKPELSNDVSVSYTDEAVNGLTYIKGILVVNKKYGLPKDYNPGTNAEAFKSLSNMQADASVLGLSLRLVSGYRSYNTQYNLYNNYVKINGQAKADTFSARPGHSEHQTGLAFDVGSTKGSFANTYESKWLAENCHLYGFIIRYPKGKTNITGYIYEPWHVRYLGVENATKVKNSGLTLEEYLGIN